MEVTNYSNILPAEGRTFFENWSEGKTFFDNWRKKFNKQTSKKAEVSMVENFILQAEDENWKKGTLGPNSLKIPVS